MDKGNLARIESGYGLVSLLVPLADVVDRRHPLCLLSDRMNWSHLAAKFADMATNSIWPPIPFRLHAALYFLKHTFHVPSESIVDRWLENPYWQYFSGEMHFRHRAPLDLKTVQQFDQLLGAERGGDVILQIITGGQPGAAPKRK